MRANELRALGRLGRRIAGREWKRTSLIAMLVLLPVAAAVVVAGIVQANDIPLEERVAGTFGAADLRIENAASGDPATDAALDRWVDTTLAELAPQAETLTYRTAHPRRFGTVFDIDVEDPIAEGFLEPWEGEQPEEVGEVAVSPALRRHLGAAIGDTLTFGGEELTVVGTVVNPVQHRRQLAVVVPEQLDRLADRMRGPTATSTTWLVADVDVGVEVAQRFDSAWQVAEDRFLPEPAVSPKPAALAHLSDELYVSLDADEIEELVERSASVPEHQLDQLAWEMVDDAEVVALPHPWVSARESELSASWQGLTDRLLTPGLVATLVAGVLLAEVALVAGAAYATGARRRLRDLGLLGANGATVWHVRVTILGEAVVTGVVGALAGLALGAGVLVLGRPLLQPMVDRALTGLPLTPGGVAGPVLAGIVAVVAAAWLPARSAARVPTTTALQGRMPLSSPPRWLVPLGVVVAGFGGLITTVSLASRGGNASSALAMMGVVMAIVGTALLTPPIIAGIGRLADRLPPTWRLAIRDSTRQRTRAAAATAAAMVLLMAPVLIGFGSAADEAQQRVRGLPAPSDHLVVVPNDADIRFDVAVDVQAGATPPAAELDGTDDGAELGRMHRVLGDDARRVDVPLVPLWGLPETGPRADDIPPEHRYANDASELVRIGTGIATGAVVDALDDDGVRDAIRADVPVVLGVTDRETSVTMPDGTVLDARELPVPVLEPFPRLLLPPGGERELGVLASSHLTLFSGVEPTDEQFTELSLLMPAGSQMVEGPRSMDPLTMRWLGVGGALLITLLILGLVTALSTTESDHDLRTMVAVGAPPRVRRRFLALQSGYHAAVGAVLAVPLGVGLIWAAMRSEPWLSIGPFGSYLSNQLIVPWDVLALVLVGVPVATGAVVGLLFRSAATVPPRRLG